MFESCMSLALTEWGQKYSGIDHEYYKCWESLEKYFDPNDISAGPK